jgi:hypothetical protein
MSRDRRMREGSSISVAPSSPYSLAVNDANRRHLLRNVQANKMGHRLVSELRITGDTARMAALRDYRMSIYVQT